MNKLPPLKQIIIGMIELGPRQLILFGLYCLCLKLGVFRLLGKKKNRYLKSIALPLQYFDSFYTPPHREGILNIIRDDGVRRLKEEADEIVQGKTRLFGGDAVPLVLTPPGDLYHWTEYEVKVDPVGGEDIKFIWEPARFGWAFKLARAYHVLGDDVYAETFWRNFQLFQKENPIYLGPNWISAQEAAFRVLAYCFAGQVFRDSSKSTRKRMNALAGAIAEHAERITLTLIYARAQNNNHLLSEAAGLLTAARVLPKHPLAARWRSIGWKWFARGLLRQIDRNGAYIQQSTNYHRLLLQLILWVCGLRYDQCKPGEGLDDEEVRQKILKAVQWLLALCDPITGQVPNLGPNDGSYIIPLTDLTWFDYRPVLQSAAVTFFGERVFVPGVYDEMYLWFANSETAKITEHLNMRKLKDDHLHQKPLVIRSDHSWAYFRAANYQGRPGHADQLHLDLWWLGENIAQDAGTYRYNGLPPWDNSLTNTAVHNTIMVNGKEQMTRVSRFLYLNKAQIRDYDYEQADDLSWVRVKASHTGYRKLGLIHTRTVTANDCDEWIVDDEIQSKVDRRYGSITQVRLHWLLPDWEWDIKIIHTLEAELRVFSPFGPIKLKISCCDCKKPLTNTSFPQETTKESPFFRIQLSRCGTVVYGTGNNSPIMGWASPTYGLKTPALSFMVDVKAELPIRLRSEWEFTRKKV